MVTKSGNKYKKPMSNNEMTLGFYLDKSKNLFKCYDNPSFVLHAKSHLRLGCRGLWYVGLYQCYITFLASRKSWPRRS